MYTFRPFKTFEMCARFTNQLTINIFENCHAPTVPKLQGKLSPKARMRNSDRNNIPGGWHVWPLYWNAARESAADSWKFGSLSPEKTAKMAIKPIFRGESASNSRQIGSLSPIRPNPH